jgi:hypothetical protein
MNLLRHLNMGARHLTKGACGTSTRDTNGACHVFLSHAGERKKSFVDCLHQLLVREGGRGQRRKQCINVFMDQHSLEPGMKAWATIEEKAQSCRIGGANEHGRFLLRKKCTPSTWGKRSTYSCVQSITPSLTAEA